MTAIGFALVILAVVLAWPIPEAVAAAQNRSRRTADPVAAVIIWQAIGVAGGFSLISACIAFALAPLVHVPGVRLDDALDWWRWPLLIAGVGLLVLLLGSLLWEARSARLHRARHREVLSLVSEPRGGAPETRVIDTDHVLAIRSREVPGPQSCRPDCWRSSTTMSGTPCWRMSASICGSDTTC